MGRGIDQLRELFAEAHIQGEWLVGKNDVYMVVPHRQGESDTLKTIFSDVESKIENRLLIAAAVNSLPAIFEVVDAARRMTRGNSLTLLERYEAAIDLSDALNSLEDVVSYPPAPEVKKE